VTASGHIVNLALFDSIDEYCDLLRSGTAISKEAVPETSPVISFCENAFAQFFENEIGVEIAGFGDEEKKRCVRMRKKRKADFSRQARSVMSLYERFCDIFEDVLGAGYGGQSAVLEDFHRLYVLRLISRIGDLASIRGDDALRVRAEDAATGFESAVDEYEWEESDG